MNFNSLELRVIEGVSFNSLVSLKVRRLYLYHLNTVDFASWSENKVYIPREWSMDVQNQSYNI